MFVLAEEWLGVAVLVAGEVAQVEGDRVTRGLQSAEAVRARTETPPGQSPAVRFSGVEHPERLKALSQYLSQNGYGHSSKDRAPKWAPGLAAAPAA